jgi:hypothetical protein
MTTAISKECIICSDTEDVVPLFSERTPSAETVAYMHNDCLSAWTDPAMHEEARGLAEEFAELFDEEKAKAPRGKQ